MKYTYLDLVYTFNHQSRYTNGFSEPAFKGIKYMVHYLGSCLNHPIMYQYGLIITGHNELHQKFLPGNLKTQQISNGLLAYEYGI